MSTTNKVFLAVLIGLVLVMVLLLCRFMGCGANRTNRTDSADTKTDTTVKELTDSRAIELAEEFAEDHGGGWKRYVNNASGIRMFKVTSSKVTERTDAYVVVVVKGSFFAEDDYGRNLGRYIYDWTVHVFPSEYVIGQDMRCQKD